MVVRMCYKRTSLETMPAVLLAKLLRVNALGICRAPKAKPGLSEAREDLEAIANPRVARPRPDCKVFSHFLRMNFCW